MEKYSDQYAIARNTLVQGNAREAFQELRGLLEYPGHPSLVEHWQITFDLLADILVQLEEQTLADRVQAAAQAPDNALVLYTLGYELIEHSLSGIAATVLHRANQLTPGDATIVGELGTALEEIAAYAEAYEVLAAVPDVVAESFVLQYLMAFYAIMSGNITEARRIVPMLKPGNDESNQFMLSRVVGMVHRYDALHKVAPLDRHDLRGWHFVVTGGLLLHLSPYGRDEGMNGRYAYIQDSPSLVREGIERLFAVLEVWQIEVPAVLVVPDRNSEILAWAIARLRNLPLIPWQPEAPHGAGLLPVYDLEALDFPLQQALNLHHPGQILWNHATCWIRDQWFAGDLTTYLYQVNVTPWETGLDFDLAPKAPPEDPAVAGNIEELAEAIVSAELGSSALEDLTDLLNLAKAIYPLGDEHGTAARQTSRARLRQWIGSPVGSNRFF